MTNCLLKGDGIHGWTVIAKETVMDEVVDLLNGLQRIHTAERMDGGKTGYAYSPI